MSDFFNSSIDYEQLLRKRRESVWDAVSAAVEITCNKLREAYGRRWDCAHAVNEHNSRITITPSRNTGVESTLQIRFDRKLNHIILTIEPSTALPAVYRMAADLQEQTVFLWRDDQRALPLQVAEDAICKGLLRMQD